MAAPPVPPRPSFDFAPHNHFSYPPPVPPVPPDLLAQETRYNTPSPYELPLAAPRPQRIDPSIPMNMANTLDEPGFVVPQMPAQQPRPDWSPWAPTNTAQHHPTQSAPSPPPLTGPPSLTAPLPTISNLQGAVHAVQNTQHDPFLKIAWARDVFFLVETAQQNPSPSTDPAVGPVVITDPLLHHLAHIAVPVVLQLANTQQLPLPPYASEAIYWRATFAASGAYPEFLKHNPRIAFRDFEAAARGGYAGAWFRLGRDYENFNDAQHARECFERGVKLGVESCAYRMGMAHLLGQLGLPANPQLAIPLLSRAATLATIQVPQPAYVYSLLLLNEFTQTSVPPAYFTPFITPGSSLLLEARKHLERAAYLHFAPAQYKLGHAYEYAQPPFPFDPLLSVQYYSLASQQGEVEADMALSKWFLCGSGESDGSGGGFEKDEVLALTFAEKAAKKGLPSAEFAMGYYAEVGVGGPKDIQSAIKWYQSAKEHGNTDAAERLSVLSQPAAQALSRQEHDTITENKLVRKRTQAKQRSEAVYNQSQSSMPMPMGYPGGGGGIGAGPGAGPRMDGRTVVEVIRKQSLMVPPVPPIPQQQQQQLQSRPISGASPHHPQYQQPQPQPHQPQPRPPYHPQNQSFGGNPGPGPGPGPGHSVGPGGPGGRQGYSLMDSPSSTPPPPAPSNGPANSQNKLPNARPGRVVSSGPKKQGPATFAEMGIQGASVPEKECVIM